MSDLRERFEQRVSAEFEPGFVEMSQAIERAWPIIEAELQKRDREIKRLTPQCEGCITGSDLGVPEYGGIAHAHPQCPIHGMQPEDYAAETARTQVALNEANKLLEQTIEVLEGLATAIDFYFVHEDGEGERRARELYEARQSAHALLDNLKALKKEGTE